jgi:dephospho-CoA kinase
MKVLGLTGGIGMGKSVCSDLFRARDLAVVDTDELARKVVAPGQPALREIREAFGEEMVGPDGQLRRKELARRVFSDPPARQRLEQMLHPRIRDLWREQVETWRSENHPFAVVVIPLLFETGAKAELDVTICVACTAATQQGRLRERGWSAEQVQQRIAAQWPIERKMAEADFIVWNEAGLDVLSAQLDRILKTLH